MGSAKVWYTSPRTDSLDLVGVRGNLTLTTPSAPSPQQAQAPVLPAALKLDPKQERALRIQRNRPCPSL